MPIETLKKRLAYYKAKMPTHGETLAAVVRNYMAPTNYTGGALSQGKTGKSLVVWYASLPYTPEARPREWNRVKAARAGIEQATGLRVLAESIEGRDYCGFYANSFQDSTLWPLVMILPKGKGFLRAYYEDDAGSFVVLSEVYADSDDCRRAARGYAESRAEDSVRHDEAFQAGCEYFNLREDAQEARRKALKLASDVHQMRRAGVTAPESICSVLRGEISAAWHTIHHNRKKARDLRKEWESAPGSWAYPFFQSFANAAGIKLN